MGLINDYPGITPVIFAEVLRRLETNRQAGHGSVDPQVIVAAVLEDLHACADVLNKSKDV